MSDRLRIVFNLPLFLLARRLVFAAFVPVSIGALLYAAWHIGPWFDEFWSFYLADPSVPLRDALLSRWAVDVHPPLFSFMAWLSSLAGLPRTLEAGRMLNLLPLALSALYLFAYWRLNRDDGAFLATFLPATTALVQFLSAFAEYRSYFTGIAAFIILLTCLKRLERRTEDPLKGANAALVWSGQLVSLTLCLNLHFVFALLAMALVGAFAFAALWRGDRRLFAVHLVTGIICCLPLAATTALQLPYLSSSSKDYWLKTPPQDVPVLVAQAIITPIGQRIGLSIIWLAALLLRILSHQKRRADDRYAAILFASFVFSAGLVLAYTVATGALTGRYLIPVCLAAAAALAALTAEAIKTHALMQVIFLATCLAITVQTSREAAGAPQWNEAASYVSAAQKACPGARIAPLRSNLNDPTANVVANYEMAYGYLARNFDMKIGPLDSKPIAPKDPGCADYYWIDNQFAANRKAPALEALLLQRFPSLKGCTINTHVMESDAVVFEVSGDLPACDR